jgi:hypothetical protein
MKKITINKILFKPYIKLGEKINIFGRDYNERISSVNLFVIETENEITESEIYFEFENVRYIFTKFIIDNFEGKTFLECKEWSEEWIETNTDAHNI